MKVARTFTIDYDLVEQLKKCGNQSKIICIALRNHFDNDHHVGVREASTLRLISELSQRNDIDNTFRVLCEQLLTNGL